MRLKRKASCVSHNQNTHGFHIRLVYLCLTLIMGFLSCLTLAQPAAPPWPTTEFVLVEATPRWDVTDYLINPLVELLPSDLEGTALKNKMESYLHRVAVEYERLGFRAPDLRVSDGKYVVYVHDFSPNIKEPARAMCPGQSNINVSEASIGIDKKVVFGSSGPDVRLWEHLAHELFHTVQYSYGTCLTDPGKFFSEGSAEALGVDMAYHILGVEPARDTTGRWAARRYDVQLNKTPFGGGANLTPAQEKTDEDHQYATASFWRYLGEYVAASGRPTIYEAPPDYSYLHKLMATPLASQSDIDVMHWLDKGLRNSIQIGLERAYASFIATFAGYTEGARFTFNTTTPEMAREKFLNYIFTSCQNMAIDLNGNTVATASFDIEPIAAACLKVEFNASTEVDIDFNIRGPDKARLTDIKIGTIGGERVTGPKGEPQPSPVGGGYIATWRFRVKTDTPKYFILSNVSRDPVSYASQKFDIVGALTGFDHTLASSDNAKAPTKNGPPKRGAMAKPGEEDNVRESAEQQHADDVANLSNMTGTSATLSHSDSVSSVCKEPFRFSPCRPSTTIRLALRSGSAGDVLSARGPGGLMAQAMYAVRAVEDYGLEETIRDLGEAKRQADNTEGSAIEIVIPRIQFGFTGTFNNASIVANGIKGVKYEAIGPRDSKPGEGVAFELSGQVSIEEYTPLILRGRFSAQLVDRAAANIAGQKDPVLPVARVVDGWFSVASPYQYEKDFKFELPAGDAFADMFLQDIAQVAPGMEGWVLDMIAAEMDKKNNTVPGETVAAPNSPVVAFPVCACGCDEQRVQDAMCEQICLPRNTFCAAPYGGDKTSNHNKSQINESAQLKQKLLEAMAARNMKTRLREFYLAEFDNAPDVDAQRLLLRSLKIPLEG